MKSSCRKIHRSLRTTGMDMQKVGEEIGDDSMAAMATVDGPNLPVKRAKYGCNNLLVEKPSISKHENSARGIEYMDSNKPSQRRIHAYFFEKKFCDVTLQMLDGARIRAHMLILCTSNRFFERTLMNSGKSPNNKKKILFTENITADTMQLLVDYCYTGKIFITDENVESLLLASQLYEFDFVSKKCVEYLTEEVNNSNALHAWRLGKKYDLKKLVLSSTGLVCDKFMQLVQTDAFQKLDEKQLYSWLSCDDVFVGSEEDIFFAITHWIRGDLDERKQHFAKLVKTMRIAGLSNDFLHRNVLEFSEEIEDPSSFMETCRRKSKGDDNQLKPRSAMCLLAVGGDDAEGRPNQITVEQFNFRFNVWTLIATIQEPCQKYSIVHNNDFIWIIGGCDPSGQPVAKVTGIRIGPMISFPLIKMNDPRYDCAAVVVDGNLYAFGGQGIDGYLDKVEVFNQKEKNWERVESMASQRASAAVVHFKDDILVIGGRNQTETLKCVESFSLKTRKWSQFPAMNKRRANAKAIIVDGTLMVFGGSDNDVTHKTYEVYQSHEEKWIEMDILFEVMPLGFGIAVENDIVYMAGGVVNGETLNTINKLNTKTGHPRKLAPMIFKRAFLHLIHRNYFAQFRNDVLG